MRVVIVGKGGRESALEWAIGNSPLVDRVTCLAYESVEQTLNILCKDAPDLVIVGPEVPLVAGLVDCLEGAGIPAFGPTAAAAMLEGSKIFMKTLCAENNIPTAPWVWVGADTESIEDGVFGGTLHAFRNADDAIRGWQSVPVIKADGLCGGKGVIVAETKMEASNAAHDMLRKKKYGAAGLRIVIEDRLEGRECSMMFFCQDEVAIPLPPARDYKRALDGDKGLNTGGMGAYSPLPDVSGMLEEEVRQRIILPTLRAMKARGTPFRGLLYAGLMLTADGPMLLEFNVRFGDPETQVVLPRLLSDIVPYLDRIAKNEPGGLARLGTPAVSSDAAVCKVLASLGYPGEYEKDKLITDLGYLPNTLVFDAGVRIDESGTQFTDGGRVMGIVGLGPTIPIARVRADERAARITYENKYERTDIALNT